MRTDNSVDYCIMEDFVTLTKLTTKDLLGITISVSVWVNHPNTCES